MGKLYNSIYRKHFAAVLWRHDNLNNSYFQINLAFLFRTILCKDVQDTFNILSENMYLNVLLSSLSFPWIFDTGCWSIMSFYQLCLFEKFSLKVQFVLVSSMKFIGFTKNRNIFIKSAKLYVCVLAR